MHVFAQYVEKTFIHNNKVVHSGNIILNCGSDTFENMGNLNSIMHNTISDRILNDYCYINDGCQVVAIKNEFPVSSDIVGKNETNENVTRHSDHDCIFEAVAKTAQVLLTLRIGGHHLDHN